MTIAFNPVTFNLQTGIPAVSALVLDFIENSDNDWEVVVIAPLGELSSLLSYTQFTAPSHLCLSRRHLSLRCDHGGIYGTTPSQAGLLRLRGMTGDRLLFVVHSTVLSGTVLSELRQVGVGSSGVCPTVLWIPGSSPQNS